MRGSLPTLPMRTSLLTYPLISTPLPLPSAFRTPVLPLVPVVLETSPALLLGVFPAFLERTLGGTAAERGRLPFFFAADCVTLEYDAAPAILDGGHLLSSLNLPL